MHIRKLAIITILSTALAIGTAAAQETDAAEAAPQQPDREQLQKHRKPLSDEQRAAMRERWNAMSDEERQAARDKMRERRAKRDAQRPEGHDGRHRPGDRPARDPSDKSVPTDAA